jgi:hypothetical protein
MPNLQFIGVYLLMMFLIGVLTMFTRFHVRLVMKNSTTIENFDKSSGEVSYNLGAAKNWEQVFGRNPWLWWVPIHGTTGKPIGDGVLWPQTFNKNEQREGYEHEEKSDNTNVIRLEVKADSSFKQSDSDTSFIASTKKSKVIDLRDQ